MIELGQIEISSDSMVVNARNKAIEMALDLGASDVKSMRIGALISETCRLCLLEGNTITIQVLYVESEVKRGIQLVVEPIYSKMNFDFLVSFTDDFFYEKMQEDLYRIRFTFYLGASSPELDYTMLEKLKQQIEMKSRSELIEMISSQNEALKVAKAIAEEDSELKRNIIRNISHELRTPISAIMGMSYILNKSNLDDEGKQCVNQIQTSCQEVVGIVEGLEDYSRATSGELKQNKRKFMMDDLLLKTVNDMNERCMDKGITLNYEIVSSMPKILYGDVEKIHQVLMLYGDNAIKFTQRGRIDIKAKVEEKVFGDVVIKFEVKDTGIGIQEDEKKELFDLFVQGDTSLSRRYGGFGLGLTLAMELVLLMNGKVGFESTYGKGSVFWFTAPLDYKESNEDEVSVNRTYMPNMRQKPEDNVVNWINIEADSEVEKKGEILVVDDTSLNIDILERVLGDDYKIRRAQSGLEALKSVAKKKPDLILLDIMMPKMNGYDVLQQLYQDELNRDIPVVFLTAISNIEGKTKGFELGAVDFITKPFEILEVKARVLTHISLAKAKRKLKERNKSLQEEVNRRVNQIFLTQEAALDSIANLAEYRDTDTGGHIERTKVFVRAMAIALKEKGLYENSLTDDNIEMLSKTAAMHDIGKIGIRDNILLKKGKLTAEEFETMKEHTNIGYWVLSSASKKLGSNSFLEYAMTFAKYHHERWDGKGYPEGISGEAIPLAGRIMSIVDVYDALRSKRCYKDAFSHEKAMSIIKEGDGTQFDPVLVETFIEINREFDEIYNSLL